MFLYSCWYSHCICTAVGTVTVYEDMQPVSHIISSSYSSRLPSYCLQHHVSPKRPPTSYFPSTWYKSFLTAMTLSLLKIRRQIFTGKSRGLQPTDRKSHTTHLVLSLNTATVSKNAVCRIKHSLNNTANVCNT
jgi:hypothetical protein